jgi:hypothetical protein
MARIKKYSPTIDTHLKYYETFVVDTEPNSKYFKITEFKDTFTGGKNGFLIEGSPELMETTEIKIEILDVDGNPIYFEPGQGIPQYYEGTSKVVAVYVYEDTPIGTADITVLGELKKYYDGAELKDIPDGWKGIYNVKWQKTFKVNRLLSNEEKVRFYKRPTITIEELVKPLFLTDISILTKSGSVNGTPVTPSANESLTNYTLPTYYKLTTTDNSFWTGSIVGSTISLPNINYSGTAVDVINSKELLVSTPYTQNGVVIPFTNQSYTASFSYLEGAFNVASALTGSFAKIRITDLTTFTGDVARVKIFRKSESQIGDYQFVQEVVLEANELLVDYDTKTKNQENYGLFTNPILSTYWKSSSGLTPTFNENYLFESAKLDAGVSSKYFYTSQSLSTTEGKEYTLSFNIRLGTNTSSKNYIRAFLSGSKQSTIGNVTKTIQIQQDFTKIYSDNSLLQKSTSTNNIKAEQMDNPQLYFEVVGDGWYIANLSLIASQETAFSPDEITFIQSVPRTMTAETFDYRFEFYDINNNYVPVRVEKNKLFTGGNLQAIKKGIFFNPKVLTFTFDSASNPVPPTIQSFAVESFLITGSITYTSRSYDMDGIELTDIDYPTGGFPGKLDFTDLANPSMTVQHFTGSNSAKKVQIVKITGATEGYTDTVTYTRILDGFGGVNHLIRPFRGTQIRNSSTQSLEIQAIRIDGINDIQLSSLSKPDKGWNLIQLHVLSGSQPYEKFINLQKAKDSGFVQGLSIGELGSKELNYNAILNRDSIDKRRTVYMISSASAASDWAYNVSSSVLASQILEDLQDGLDSGIVKFNADTFNIDYRNSEVFAPTFGYATASFYIRGSNTEVVTASFQVFPSMSINKDYVPEYWMYYTTQSVNSTISVTAIDENKNVIDSLPLGSYIGNTNKQSKNLTITFTYTEPYTNVTANVDKTFTIVPHGKPGDESIVFEVVPSNVTLNSNSKGVVLDYKPSITDIKLKQGSRYLSFTASAGQDGQDGTFHIAQNQITSINITPGNVYFNYLYTQSLSASAASNFTELSGSITYPLIIHPYYTSSIYTASIVQQFTKAVDGPPPVQVIINPATINLGADQIGIIRDYSPANTTIKLKEGTDYLVYTASKQPGTFQTSSIIPTNISVATLKVDPTDTTNLIVSGYSGMNSLTASVQYNFTVYPYSLLPGHTTGSIAVSGSQNILRTKDGQSARSVTLTANSLVISYDGDAGVDSASPGDITLSATSFGITGSAYYQFFKDGSNITSIQTSNTTGGIGSSNLPIAGAKSVYKVEVRDGSATLPVVATAEITIAGVKAGGDGYTITLTNENTSVVYKVSGATTTVGTGTSILATKGTTALTHVPTFNNLTYDNDGNYIGSLGQYKVTIDSKDTWITLAGSLAVGGTVPTVSNVAKIGDFVSYASPNLHPTATVVYKIDVEDGRAIYYKTESISVNYEGNTGPGVVMRGVYNNTTNYIGSVETTNYRRDAVIYPDPTTVSDGVTTYYAALSGSGPASSVHAPSGTTANTQYWEYLGTQSFFVSAKLAIFDESYVKNTLNVGTYADTSKFANVIIAGGRTDPYIAIGQHGTYGTGGGGYSPSDPAIIGYGQEGIYLGIYEYAATNGTTGRFSISNADGSKSLKWDGSQLLIRGSIKQTEAGANEPTLKGAWAAGVTYYNNDVVSYSGQAWICTSAVSHVSTNNTNATTGYPGSGPWNVYVAKGTNGANGSNGPGVVYRGNYDGAKKYYFNATRRDVVSDGAVSPTYYLANNSAKDGLATWDILISSDWTTFGAQFSSVATDILLAQNATITNGLTLGTLGSNSGYIKSADASSLLGTGDTLPGFYLNVNGNLRLGQPIATGNNYLYWDGGQLNISGSVTATKGQIGGWNIQNGQLRNDTGRLVIDPNIPGISINDSDGTKRLDYRYGSLSFPTSTNVTIAPVSPYINFESWYGVANVSTSSYANSTTFTVATTGTYTNNSSYGTLANNFLSCDADWRGYATAEVYVEVIDILLGGSAGVIYAGTAEINTNGSFGAQSVDLADSYPYQDYLNLKSGTDYQLKTTVEVHINSNYYAGTIELGNGGSPTIASKIYTIQLNQTELTNEGLQIMSSNTNWLRLQRGGYESRNAIIYTQGNSDFNTDVVNDSSTTTTQNNSPAAGRFYNAQGSGGYAINVVSGQSRFANLAFSTGGSPNKQVWVTTEGLIVNANSDRTMKENIVPYTNGLKQILQLNPVSFNWTDRKLYGNTTDLGLIAQEVEPVLPELVGTSTFGQEDETKFKLNLSYDKLVIPLINAVKELSAKVDRLEAEISSSKI